MSEAAWPYLVVLLAGFLPNEIFRFGAVVLSRGLNENSELFTWVKIVALALLAAVVSKLIYASPAALASVPLWVRAGAVAIGVAAFYGARRSLALGILAGEAALIATAWWLGPR